MNIWRIVLVLSAQQPFPLILAKNNSFSIKNSLSTNWQGCQSSSPTLSILIMNTKPRVIKILQCHEEWLVQGWVGLWPKHESASIFFPGFDMYSEISRMKCNVDLGLLATLSLSHLTGTAWGEEANTERTRISDGEGERGGEREREKKREREVSLVTSYEYLPFLKPDHYWSKTYLSKFKLSPYHCMAE